MSSRAIKYTLGLDESDFKRGAGAAESTLERLGRQAETTERALSLKVDVDLDALNTLRTRLATQRQELTDRIKVDVDLDAGTALREMQRIDREISRIDGRIAKASVDVDIDKPVTMFGRLSNNLRGSADGLGKFNDKSAGLLQNLPVMGAGLAPVVSGMGALGPYGAAAAGGIAAVAGAAVLAVAPGAIGGLVTAIGVKGGAGLLGAFDQLEKQSGKFDIVFGGSADAVSDWAEALSTDIGMGTRELETFAANVQDLLVPQGFDRGAAADITTQIVERGAALAEFSGREAADGIDAVSKAMLGERESLKQLGVSITQAEVDQKKAFLKSQDNYKGLNDKQLETVATLELVKEKSGDAWTAFEEGGATADGVMDTLNSTLANLKTDAIEGFGGILVDIIEDLGGMSGELGDLGDWIAGNGKQIRGLFVDLAIFIADSAESALDLADAIVTGLVDSAPMVSTWVRMLGAAAAAAQVMSGAMLLMVPGMRDTGKALIDSAGNTQKMADSAADVYSSFAETFGPKLQSGIKSSRDAVGEVGDKLRDLKAMDQLQFELAAKWDGGAEKQVKSQLKALSADQLAVIIAKADQAGATKTDKELAKVADKVRKAKIEAEATKTAEAARKFDTTAETRQAIIEAMTKKTGEADKSLDGVAKDRTSDITANALTGAAASELGATARDRTTKITADALTAAAEAELNRAARDRTAKIRAIQQVASSGAYSTGGKSSRSASDRAAGATTTNTTTTRVVNIYTAQADAGAIARALNDYAIRQGRQPGDRIAVAW